MRALRSSEIVSIWEKGQEASRVDIGMMLLQAAFPETPPRELLKLTVGQRDALLLRLRALTLGSHLEAMAECPRCRERLEFSFQAEDIQFADLATPVPLRHTLTRGDWEIRLRPLNSADLLAIRNLRDGARARLQLVARSVSQAWYRGEPASLDEAPSELLVAAGELLAERDPQSEVPFRLQCPACGTSWSVLFDVITFFFRELSRMAERILAEVPALAKAYGWSETEILALTPAKRRFYLAAVG